MARRRALPLLCLLALLVLTCGCQQVRCAADTTVATVGNAWSCVRNAVTPDTRRIADCGPPIGDEVYSHPCGGDNGIGRGGTGAFKVP